MDGNTINAVFEIMNKRQDSLIELAKKFERDGDQEFAEAYRGRAWELVLMMDQIERVHAETPSSVV